MQLRCRNGMRPWPLVLFAALSLTPTAHAHIAVEPLREVLASAAPEVHACALTPGLPAGRYVVRLVVGSSGDVTTVEFTETPQALPTPATDCLLAAFRRLRFPSSAPAPTLRVRVHGRRARVPALPGESAAGSVTINWPFVVVS